MKCTITIDMGNAAFEQDPGTELARILRQYANTVEDADRDMLLYETKHGLTARDINGNTVGALKVTQ